MEQTHDSDFAADIEHSTERYWLTGMDLDNAKRRALIEHSQQEAEFQGRLRAAARQH